MASFQAKIVWKMPRKRENKNYRFVSILLDPLQKIPKEIAKKLKNTIIASFKARIGWKGRERKKINLVVLFRSYPTRNRKFQKNGKKIKKQHYFSISRHHRLKENEKGRK